MLINGTRADDLAGTGLITKQRWAVPLWLSLLAVTAVMLARVAWTVAWWALRHPVTSTAAVVVTLVYHRAGVRGLVLLGLGVWAVVGVWALARPASLDRVVIQRARGAWRWAIRYRRVWYPALHGSGLTVTTPDRLVYVPQVTKVRSTSVVDTLHVRLLHGHTPADLAAKAEGLRHSFAVHRVSVVEDGPGRVRLVCYARDPLTAPVPAIGLDDLPAIPDLTALDVALAEDGTRYRLHLLGRHVLVAGASGAGKGSVLWSIIRALGPGVASGLVQLRGIDPKGGMELYPGRALFTCYADEDTDQMAGLLETAVRDMNARKARLKDLGVRDFTPSTSEPLVVVVIDEMAFLTAYTDKATKARVAQALQLLLSQGRAVGYSVIACLQDPRKDVLPFRDLFTYRIALRLTEDAHVDMVLGDGALERGAACHLIPASLPGVGFVHVDGAAEPVRVRFTWITDDDITGMAARWPAPTGRVIDLREHGTHVPRQRRTPGGDRAEGGEPA
jgi:DNA segregation ATPase FtsK/SpoIIIE, S-DNA-T family